MRLARGRASGVLTGPCLASVLALTVPHPYQPRPPNVNPLRSMTSRVVRALVDAFLRAPSRGL